MGIGCKATGVSQRAGLLPNDTYYIRSYSGFRSLVPNIICVLELFSIIYYIML